MMTVVKPSSVVAIVCPVVMLPLPSAVKVPTLKISCRGAVATLESGVGPEQRASFALGGREQSW